MEEWKGRVRRRSKIGRMSQRLWEIIFGQEGKCMRVKKTESMMLFVLGRVVLREP